MVEKGDGTMAKNYTEEELLMMLEGSVRKLHEAGEMDDAVDEYY